MICLFIYQIRMFEIPAHFYVPIGARKHAIVFISRIHDQARKRKDPIPYRGLERYAWLCYADV